MSGTDWGTAVITSLIVSSVIAGAYLRGVRDGRADRAGATPRPTPTAGVACTGPHGPRHMPTVVYRRRLRDGFARSYWVECWECPIRLGPFTRGFARLVETDLSRGARA